jgi:hypothetical protein
VFRPSPEAPIVFIVVVEVVDMDDLDVIRFVAIDFITASEYHGAPRKQAQIFLGAKLYNASRSLWHNPNTTKGLVSPSTLALLQVFP